MEESPQHRPYQAAAVAPRLKAVRRALGLQKGQFADLIGIDRSSYSKIEKGIKPLLPDRAYKIFELYGVDMNFIYLGQVGGLPERLSKAVMHHLNGGHA